MTAVEVEPGEPQTGPILVGVSVATGSKLALQWAAEEARQHSAPLRAVMAWKPSPAPGAANGRPPARNILEYDLQALAQETLETYVRDALGADTNVECRAVQGKTRPVMLKEAAQASLLVLDSPRTSKRSSSLSQYLAPRLISHSPCPVVVMPMPVTRAAVEAKQERDQNVEEPAEITG